MYLETQRLILRTVTLDDVDDMVEMQNDEVVLKYNCMKPMDIEEMRNFILTLQTDEKHIVLHHKEEKKVIGFIDLSPDSLRYGVKSLTLSFYLNTNYTSKGYMSEALRNVINHAFQTLQLDVVSARAFLPNLTSNRLLIRLGFTHEGTLRQAIQGYRGVIYDDCLYSMTKDDFIRLNRQDSHNADSFDFRM